jgi:hypothetical protein
MAGNRRLIDECTVLGREAKFVYWMLWGWSNWGWPAAQAEQASAVWRTTLDLMAERVPEPWWLLVNVQHLALAAERGLLGKAIFFPYGALEPEPSPPQTQLYHARLKERIEAALAHPHVAGVMGQCQTPLAQLPNIYFFMNALWDVERRHHSIATSTHDLAALLYPRAADLIGRAWALLGGTDPDGILGVADELDAAINGDALGPTGSVGRLLGPASARVVEDLVFLLRIRGYGEQFRQRLDAGDALDASRASLAAYVRAALTWQARHGYHAMGGAKYVYDLYRAPVNEAWQRYDGRIRATREHGANFDIRWPVKAIVTQEEQFPAAAIDLMLTDALSPQQLRS